MLEVINTNVLPETKSGKAYMIDLYKSTNGETRVIFIAKSQSEYTKGNGNVKGTLKIREWLANKELIPALKDGWILRTGEIAQGLLTQERAKKEAKKLVNDELGKIQKGYFTVQDEDGHRTYRFREWNNRTVISLLTGRDNENDYTAFGFLFGEKVRFWRKVEWSSEVRERTLADIATILGDPEDAGKRFARESKKCARCGRTLTNPDSLDAYLGPECQKTGFLVFDIEPEFEDILE